jgi:hypothetical protein
MLSNSYRAIVHLTQAHLWNRSNKIFQTERNWEKEKCSRSTGLCICSSNKKCGIAKDFGTIVSYNLEDWLRYQNWSVSFYCKWNFIENHIHPLIYLLSRVSLISVITEAIWPRKTKNIYYLSSTEQVCQSLLKMNERLSTNVCLGHYWLGELEQLILNLSGNPLMEKRAERKKKTSPGFGAGLAWNEIFGLLLISTWW